jgi:Flp pilus assembly protein TadG
MRLISGRVPQSKHQSATGDQRCHPLSGQSVIELALALPLLLLILLGTIDLGRLYADYTDLKGAVREGAGYGAYRPTDSAGIRARVLNHGVPAGTSVSVSCLGSCDVAGGSATIVVQANSTFKPVALGFLSMMGLGSVNLSAEARMRVME